MSAPDGGKSRKDIEIITGVFVPNIYTTHGN